MMRSLITLPVMGLALSGCSLIFPDDSREGVEGQEACINRIGPTLTYQDFQQLENASGQWVPTYTYDVTKLDLAAIQALSVPGTDETAGTRLMQQNNSTNAAVLRFLEMEVTEKGAFFLGREPSLYRVRGKPQPASNILASGCKRQKADMRLIAVSWVKQAPKPEPESSDTDADQGTPTSQTDT